ncbi:2496_t:CDS:2, partial [Paraglomus occultum]
GCSWDWSLSTQRLAVFRRYVECITTAKFEWEALVVTGGGGILQVPNTGLYVGARVDIEADDKNSFAAIAEIGYKRKNTTTGRYSATLVLIGMRGAGKTTLGKLAFNVLKRKFIDDDVYLEQS